MTRRLPPSAAAAKPIGYLHFVEDARVFVESKGLSWAINVDKHGSVADELTGDLQDLTGSHARHAATVKALSVEPEIRAAALEAGFSPATLPDAGELPTDAMECIKAGVATRGKEGRLDKSTRVYTGTCCAHSGGRAGARRSGGRAPFR